MPATGAGAHSSPGLLAVCGCFGDLVRAVPAAAARDLGDLARGVGRSRGGCAVVVAAGSALDPGVSAGAGAMRGWLYALVRAAGACAVGVFLREDGEMRLSAERRAREHLESRASVCYMSVAVRPGRLRGKFATFALENDRLLTEGRFAYRARSEQYPRASVRDGRRVVVSPPRADF